MLGKIFNLRISFAFFLVLSFFCANFSIAQRYDIPRMIYNDKTVKVFVSFAISKNICTENSTMKSYWRYQIVGKNKTGKNKYLHWDMEYLNCNNDVIRITNSLDLSNFEQYIILDDTAIIEDRDFEFNGSKVIKEPNNPKLLNVPSQFKPLTVANIELKPPLGIDGDKKVNVGQSFNLTVRGSQLEGSSKWVWYKDSCNGAKVGVGETISLTQSKTSTYFVKSENAYNKSDCISFVVEVDNKSYPPISILGAESICRPGKIQLTVNGGKLGLSANWYWYTDSLLSNSIAFGSRLEYNLVKSTKFFVKAVGQENETEPVSLEVNVDSVYIDPDKIVTGKSEICEGDNVELNVIGGTISGNAKWVWYTGSKIVGYGKSILVSPKMNSTYKVRGEGGCGVTNFTQLSISVLSKSQPASSIDVSESVITSKKNVVFTLKGGRLESGSDWYWYNDSSLSNPIATGLTFTSKFKKSTTVYLRAENLCYKTTAIQRHIFVEKEKGFTFLNFGVIGNDLSKSDNPFSTLSLTLGSKKKNGYYIRGKLSIASSISTNYNSSDNLVNNYTVIDAYYKFNGKEQISRSSLTAGMLLGSNSFMLYFGGGYGKKELYWGIDEISVSGNGILRSNWTKNVSRSISGPEIEIGLLIRTGFFNLMGGVNSIVQLSSDGNESLKYKNFIDAYLGLGITF